MRGQVVCVLLTLCIGTAFGEPCRKAMVASPTPFLAVNDEVLKLDDGTFWQVKYAYEYLYEYYPAVTICPDQGILIIKGKSINVAPLGKSSTPSSSAKSTQGIIESRIDDEFEGFEADKVFVLQNGQIWQQTSARYKYVYKYAPRVRIFPVDGGYEMSVDGVEGTIRVQQLTR
ncbi:MAG: hypothetical protein QM773_05555 [Hyphomonadaceae bacterium]